MKKEIFYTGLEIRANKPIDERLQITTLSVSELQRVFGNDGRYGYAKAWLFNAGTNQFMYLSTYSTKADVIVTSNWTTIGENVTKFPLYVSTNTYSLGDAITFEDSYNVTRFYIGLAPIGANQNPESNPELWFNLSSAASLTVMSQKIEYRLDTRDPEGLSTRQFTIVSNVDISNAGTRIPNIVIHADFDETISGMPAYRPISPQIRQYTESGQIKFEIIFSGDLSDIKFLVGTPSQKNIFISLS